MWIVAWALFFIAGAGACVTFAAAIAGMGLVALIAGVITVVCGGALFAASVS
ncbi:MAG TPA: hypothetical protein VF760_11460 [Xanthobacteraceae bacterium]